MSETKHYLGSCHCGAVAFDVDLDVSGALKCNCSICNRLGAVWAFAPKAKFKLESGGDEQGDYQFGKKSLHHRFCKSCGIESYAEGVAPDGSPTVGINLRCVEGIDVDTLATIPWDGRSK
ncbi:MAG: glutathione-dependent formaldehyde-activating [Reyranella sp.]|jgi:hypothetical protein|nr:glutathione-dependent formaldehyde-activating [Reyranella sp.]